MTIPDDATGWRVIPAMDVLRGEYRADMGLQRGNYAADALDPRGWRCVSDLRRDGSSGFVCERDTGDGRVQSVLWDARQIRSMYPPR